MRFIPFPRSISFKIIGYNLAVFLLAFLLFFYFLDRFQQAYLLDRTDADLEAGVLVITSRIDSGLDRIGEMQTIIDRMGLAQGIARGFIRILDEQGQELASSDLEFWPDVRQLTVPQDLLNSDPLIWQSARLATGDLRLIYYRFPDGSILQVGHGLADMQNALNHFRVFSASAMAVMMLLGGILSWWVTFGALRGIRQVSGAAAIIREQGTLSYRVPFPTGSSETDQLAETFNSMLERIQRLVRELRHVMDDIAHDIKTPVTRMRGVAEARLIEANSQDPHLAGQILEECDLILNLVNTLLQITAAESGLYHWDIRPQDLAALVHEGCDLFQPIIEDKELQLHLDLPDQLILPIDSRAMQRVVANLVDNAIKYTEPGGTIGVALTLGPGSVTLEVSDSGIGIPSEELTLVFNRFYRTDRSRTRPGNGLGLAFCKAIVEGHGGTISCRSAAGQGTIFAIKLPLEPGS